MSERIGQEYTSASRMVMKRNLLDNLADRYSFELPPALVDTEAKQIAHQLWHEDNPDVEGHDHDPVEPTKDHIELAERRVRLGLVLAEIGSKNEIQVTEAEVQQAVMAQARQYQGHEQQFMEFVQKNPQMQQQITAPIYEDKVVDFLFELAKIKDKSVSKDDLEKAVKELEEE